MLWATHLNPFVVIETRRAHSARPKRGWCGQLAIRSWKIEITENVTTTCALTFVVTYRFMVFSVSWETVKTLWCNLKPEKILNLRIKNNLIDNTSRNHERSLRVEPKSFQSRNSMNMRPWIVFGAKSLLVCWHVGMWSESYLEKK